MTAPSGLTQLWTINANGSDKRRVYQGLAPNAQYAYAAWSPDWSPGGKQIAAETNGGTVVMNADGTDVHRVAAPPGRTGQLPSESLSQVAWQPIPLTHR